MDLQVNVFTFLQTFTDVYFLQGTGKTTTLTEIIHQMIHIPNTKPPKILITAPSNVAVDNLLQSIINSFDTVQTKRKRNKKKQQVSKYKRNIVRIGHPARISKHLLDYSLESLVYKSDEMQIVHDVVVRKHTCLI